MKRQIRPDQDMLRMKKIIVLSDFDTEDLFKFFSYLIKDDLITSPLNVGLILSGVTQAFLLQLAKTWSEFKITERYPTMKVIKCGVKEKRVQQMFGASTAFVVFCIYEQEDVLNPPTFFSYCRRRAIEHIQLAIENLTDDLEKARFDLLLKDISDGNFTLESFVIPSVGKHLQWDQLYYRNQLRESYENEYINERYGIASRIYMKAFKIYLPDYIMNLEQLKKQVEETILEEDKRALKDMFIIELRLLFNSRWTQSSWYEHNVPVYSKYANDIFYLGLE